MLKRKIIHGYGIELSSDGVVLFRPGKPHRYPLRRTVLTFPWRKSRVKRREDFWEREARREYKRLVALGASHDAAAHGTGFKELFK